jgi:hypothetical protein
VTLRYGGRLTWRHADGTIKPNALAVEIAVGYQFQGEAAEFFGFA